MKKTNAQRVLEAHGIEYRATVYDDQGEFHSADEAAHLIGASPESVYKTLVVLREEGRAKPLLVMIASNREVDLRLLAKSLGEKKLRMATRKEAEQLTGAQVGGISVLAQLNRGFEFLIDRGVLALGSVHISGGIRGLDVQLRVDDLIKLTGARTIQVTRADSEKGGDESGTGVANSASEG